MPLIVLNAADKAAALAQGQADLKFLLSDNDIDEEAQAVIFEAGFTRVRTFLGLGESRDEVKQTLKSEFTWDVDDSLALRVLVSKVLSAWDDGKRGFVKEAEARAEARANQ
eukprot:7208915-Karenia_brevis.AAC.1